jgi:hypothetical protein
VAGGDEFPTVRWDLDDAPEVDDSTLAQRDRTYLDQVRVEAELRARLGRPRPAAGEEHGELAGSPGPATPDQVDRARPRRLAESADE